MSLPLQFYFQHMLSTSMDHCRDENEGLSSSCNSSQGEGIVLTCNILPDPARTHPETGLRRESWSGVVDADTSSTGISAVDRQQIRPRRGSLVSTATIAKNCRWGEGSGASTSSFSSSSSTNSLMELQRRRSASPPPSSSTAPVALVDHGNENTIPPRRPPRRSSEPATKGSSSISSRMMLLQRQQQHHPPKLVMMSSSSPPIVQRPFVRLETLTRQASPLDKKDMTCSSNHHDSTLLPPPPPLDTCRSPTSAFDSTKGGMMERLPQLLPPAPPRRIPSPASTPIDDGSDEDDDQSEEVWPIESSSGSTDNYISDDELEYQEEDEANKELEYNNNKMERAEGWPLLSSSYSTSAASEVSSTAWKKHISRPPLLAHPSPTTTILLDKAVALCSIADGSNDPVIGDDDDDRYEAETRNIR